MNERNYQKKKNVKVKKYNPVAIIRMYSSLSAILLFLYNTLGPTNNYRNYFILEGMELNVYNCTTTSGNIILKMCVYTYIQICIYNYIAYKKVTKY